MFFCCKFLVIVFMYGDILTPCMQVQKQHRTCLDIKKGCGELGPQLNHDPSALDHAVQRIP